MICSFFLHFSVFFSSKLFYFLLVSVSYLTVEGFLKCLVIPNSLLFSRVKGLRSWLLVVCMWWELLILRFTVRLFDWAICWGSLNVCLLRPLLFSPVIRFATDKLSKTCPEVKSHRQRPGTKPSGTEGAVSPCTVQMFYGPPGVFIVVVVIAHLPSHFPCVPQARNPLSLVSRRMREGQDSGQSPREWERRSGQTTLSQLALLQLSFSQPPPRLQRYLRTVIFESFLDSVVRSGLCKCDLCSLGSFGPNGLYLLI